VPFNLKVRNLDKFLLMLKECLLNKMMKQVIKNAIQRFCEY